MINMCKTKSGFVFLLFFIITSNISVASNDNLYKTGPNLIKNCDFKQVKNFLPTHWNKNIQLNEAKGIVQLIKDKEKGTCAQIYFTHDAYMLQARYYQMFDISSDKVYELKYAYRSDFSKDLRADIMLTGTGRIYRCYYQEPSQEWVTRKILFYVPRSNKKASISKAGIYVQNRSKIPICYSGISLRETNIDITELKKYQPTITIQPVSSNDQLILPDHRNKYAEFLLRDTIDEKQRKNYEYHLSFLGSSHKVNDILEIGNLIKIPISNIPNGQSLLSVMLVNKNDDTIIATTRLFIERLSTEDFLSSTVIKPTIFKDSSGKPFFPIGMYGLNKWGNTDDFLFLIKNGFNTVHTYSFSDHDGISSMDHIHSFLDHATHCGMKVITEIPRPLAEKEGKEKLLEKWIKSISYHKSILYYYSDEMYSIRRTPINIFKSTYQTLKKADPSRSYILYEHPEKKLKPYIDGCMLGVESTNSMKLVQLRLGENKPVFNVFGQEYKKETLPSEKEIQYAVFMPIILGCRGVFYFWYPFLKWHHEQKEILQSRLFYQIKLLSNISKILLQDDIKYKTFDILASGDLQYCSAFTKNKCLIIAGVHQNNKKGSINIKLNNKKDIKIFRGHDVKKISSDKINIDLSSNEIAIITIQ